MKCEGWMDDGLVELFFGICFFFICSPYSNQYYVFKESVLNTMSFQEKKNAQAWKSGPLSQPQCKLKQQVMDKCKDIDGYNCHQLQFRGDILCPGDSPEGVEVRHVRYLT